MSLINVDTLSTFLILAGQQPGVDSFFIDTFTVSLEQSSGGEKSLINVVGLPRMIGLAIH